MNVVKRLSILIVVLMLLTRSASAANGVIYVSPENGTYTVGQTFDMHVMVDTDGAPISAAEAEISFNPAGLAVQHISTKGSILETWSTEPTFSNAAGTITFTGWTKDTYTGKDGLLITVTFKALRDMTSNARLAAGAILAAGGDGSNIITSMRSATYAVRPQQVAAKEPPQPAETVPAPLSTPAFIAYQDSVQAGDHIVLKGIAAPGSKVQVWLQKGDETGSNAVIEAGEDGSFTYVSDSAVMSGAYRAWARASSADGRISEMSDKISITVRDDSFAASLRMTGLFALMMLPFLIVVVVAGLGTGYITHRHRIEKLKSAQS